MDPLSDVLTLLDATIDSARALMAPAQWGLHFPVADGLTLFAVQQGSARFCTRENRQWHTLNTGDAIIVTRPQRIALTTLTGTLTGRAESAPSQKSHYRTDYGGDNLVILTGHMALDPGAASLLLDQLPRVVMLSQLAEASPGIMDALCREIRTPGPGAEAITAPLMQLMIVEGLRSAIRQRQTVTPGWMRALDDPRMVRVLSAIHQSPAHPWTLPGLAEIATLSRAGFARRFALLAGSTPLHYLAHWRVQLAAKALRTTQQPVKTIAFALGFGSKSAFSTAFRRIYGVSPAQLRGQQ
ncbi:AraC family transcriptional regulator [Shimwellia pseudoproteus]|uniref:AraC family transcriptional regulator n=1 Tax=Shimwellia pseudoproteus TaxID=570012 RepID=UPI0018EB33E3|nr:AraC family transcriptional regulator [Shimwellia pseudoproteus]MBJ3816153.1 AraC family transcriptional regulator [Shimwellia pseudoproteus]